MTTTINKVRNYVLLGTIISASATAPAQAVSLGNVNSNNDLTKTDNYLASDESQDNSAQTQECKQVDSCISFPEFDFHEELNKKDSTNSIDNSFLKKAKDTIQTIQGASLYQVITTEDGVEHIVYKPESTSEENPELYTSIYFSAISQREKVPEPSALIGLITFFLLAAKHQKAKNSHRSLE